MKRKVLFVAHHLTIGGAQKSLINILRAFDYERYDVTLYVRKNRLDLLNQIDNRVNVIVNQDTSHYYRKPIAICFLILLKICRIFHATKWERILKEKLSNTIRNRMMNYEIKHNFDTLEYDIAISYIQGYSADLVAERIKAKKKYLFYHSSTDEAHEFHEQIFPKYDTIVAVGDEIKKELIKWYPSSIRHVEVLYNYVDYIDVQQKANEFDIKKENTDIVLCTCGRLNPVKGFDMAIKSAKLLKDHGDKFIWYFVGDGSERSKLEEMIREKELEDYVLIVGMKSNPYPWIKACDIYIQTSYEEAYGLTIAEAQMLCKPVVTTATVGGQYLVQNMINGVVCDINDVAISDSIQMLIDSRDNRDDLINRLKSVDYSKTFQHYKAKLEEVLER